MRSLTNNFIDAVQTFVDPTRSIGAFTNMLAEALQAASHGNRHPLFAKDDDADRVRPTRRIKELQASAAAVLQYARCYHHKRQNEWAKKIVTTLGKYGLRNKCGNYSPDAVIKWRNACEAGTHLASSHYQFKLEYWIGSNFSPEDILDCVAFYCQEELGVASGLPHRGFSDDEV